MQFPLCILQEIPKNPAKTFELMISFGVAYYAKSIKEFTMQDIMRQLMYDYYRNQKVLSNKMIAIIENNVEIDEDYNGFSGEKFYPFLDCSGESLEKILNEYPELRNESIENYKIHMAAEFYNLNHIDRTQKIKEVSTLQLKHESMHGKQPMPSVNTELLFSFRDNPQNIELFMAYAAIKSLIGQGKFTGTCRQVIVMRMIGAKSKDALGYALKDKTLKKIYDKYFNRYWFDKLLNELLSRNFLKSKLGFKRKIYLSTKYDFNELPIEVAKLIKSKDMKSKEKQAKKELLQQLYNTTSI